MGSVTTLATSAALSTIGFGDKGDVPWTLGRGKKGADGIIDIENGAGMKAFSELSKKIDAHNLAHPNDQYTNPFADADSKAIFKAYGKATKDYTIKLSPEADAKFNPEMTRLTNRASLLDRQVILHAYKIKGREVEAPELTANAESLRGRRVPGTKHDRTGSQLAKYLLSKEAKEMGFIKCEPDGECPLQDAQRTLLVWEARPKSPTPRTAVRTRDIQFSTATPDEVKGKDSETDTELPPVEKAKTLVAKVQPYTPPQFGDTEQTTSDFIQGGSKKSGFVPFITMCIQAACGNVIAGFANNLIGGGGSVIKPELPKRR